MKSQLMLLALIAGHHVFAAPTFIVPPYQQPGFSGDRKLETRSILWQVASDEGRWVVHAHDKSKTWDVFAQPIPMPDGTFLFRADFKDLPFDDMIEYEVQTREGAAMKGSFRTRTLGDKLTFAVLGDSGANTKEERMVASRVYAAKPDMLLHTGDYVYDKGRVSEYAKNLFPEWLAASGSATSGAPILRDIPVYVAAGNHDVNGNDLAATPDGLAYFLYHLFPLNGPAITKTLNLKGSDDATSMFKKVAGKRFPQMLNYSFDNGPVHFVVLDANKHINPKAPELIEWLEKDLKASKAKWKIVAFHQPGFHSSKKHQEEQRMRWLAPVFERLGVDLVLNGHVHNYQRSKPLTFVPESTEDDGSVTGKFTIDTKFDGKSVTKPKGIIYIVSGAGGANLYDPAQNDASGTWQPFTEKFISDRHSFTLVQISGNRLSLKQIDTSGNEIDRIDVTK